ncbi:MAG TPA: PAS domain S-box protein [Burkholderiales bacterium]|nr:PAS domain S-box protein [Burkholderiales bacterium]
MNAPRTLDLILPQARVDAARVAALFGIAKTVYAATLVAGALVVAMLWGETPVAALATWYGVLAAVTLARLGLHRAHAAHPERRTPLAWERRFALGAFTAGLLWALPIAAFFPQAPVLQTAVLLVTAAAVVGAAGVYAASAAAFYGFCLPPILAVVVQFARQPGEVYPLLALAALVFVAAMVRVYRDMHANVVGALGARAEKEALLERVAQSEARLRDAIEGFPEGIAVFDEDGRVLASNDAYTTVAGEARAAGAAEAPAVRQFRTRDGRWMQGHFVRMERGGAVGVFTDVSDLKRAQAAFEAALAERDLVLDALPLGVAFVENRVIARCNARLERMLGYEPGELAGQSARLLYPSDAAWRGGAAMYEALSGGALYEGDGELRRKDGTTQWCRAWARTLNPAAPQEATIIAFSDIAERRAAEQALAASEALYRSLVETSNDLVWSVDRDGRWTYLNPEAVRRIYGGRPADLLGHAFHEPVVPALRERDRAVFERVLAGEPVFRHETRHRRSDGTSVDLSFNAVPLRDARGAIVGATGTARDITEERRAAAALHEGIEKLRLAVEAAELVYWEWDQASGELHWGRDPSGRLGAQNGHTVRWSEYVQLVHPEDRERYLAETRAAWSSRQPYGAEYRVIGREGQVAWISARGKVLTDSAGRAQRMIGVSQDITERKRREEEDRFLAYHDTLTGLPNRRLLDDRLRQALYLAQRRGTRLAVMLVDLDDFKRVNDERGHRAGDAVLRQVAQRLADCVRKADTLARQGGDEFVVVIPELAQDGDAEVVAQKILRALAEPVRAEGEALRVGASIGISLHPGDAGDGDALLRNADAAMYRAKQSGGNQYCYYGR